MSEGRAQIGRMALGPGEETMAVEWGHVQEHHELEIGTTEESVQMYTFAAFADFFCASRRLAKGDCQG